jgi:hypothetical protein
LLSLAQRFVQARVAGPSFGIRAASSAAVRSAASFPLIPVCPGTQRIITFPGPKLSLTRWDQRLAASAKVVNVVWLDDVVGVMRERATSRLSRQTMRLSEFGSYRAACFLEAFQCSNCLGVEDFRLRWCHGR